MRIFKLSALLTLAVLISTSCKTPKEFVTDVKTDKKPWTHLNFNNDPSNFQFAIVSDRNGGNRPGIFEDAIDKFNLMQPEFVLSVGDLISGYTTDTMLIRKQWDEVNATISKLEMPYFYLPGNHDITNKVMEKEWENRYGRRYYYFIYKNVLFIILDSNDDDDYNLTEKQRDFVLNTLKENQKVRWTFVLMHHPIWTYDTGGRFEAIQAALKYRKHTVIAGHTHQYFHEEKNGANYYILGTTGAGSSLRGTHFGEFDHITWMTMGKDGPIMANLKLDGILPHDISNEITESMAQPLTQNARFENLILCNDGDEFRHGTLYVPLSNPTGSKLKVIIHFYHHHQLQIKNASINEILEPGENRIIEIPFSSLKPIDYEHIDLLIYDWQLFYNDPRYKGFGLSGTYQCDVKPTATSFITKPTNIFTNPFSLVYKNPFPVLDVKYTPDNEQERIYTSPVEIAKSTKVSFKLTNKSDESTQPEVRFFEKTVLLPAATVKTALPGLKFAYYEGKWGELPDLSVQNPVYEGIATDFDVASIAKRANPWAIKYTGYIMAEDDAIYQFRFRVDHSCRMKIDDLLVVDDKKIVKGDVYSSCALAKGFHKVSIEYFRNTGEPRLRFYWKKESLSTWKADDFSVFSHD